MGVVLITEEDTAQVGARHLRGVHKRVVMSPTLTQRSSLSLLNTEQGALPQRDAASSLGAWGPDPRPPAPCSL